MYRHFIILAALCVATAPPVLAQGEQATEVCGTPTETCGAFVTPECTRRSAAGAIPIETAEACQAQLDRYRACIASIAQLCGAAPAPPVAAGVSNEDALEMWRELKNSGDPEALEAFADAYPGSPLSTLARNRASALRGGAAPVAAPEPVAPAQPTPQEIALRGQRREAQTLLNQLGYSVGTPDGIWGARSKQGLSAFQRAEGLTPTGWFEPAVLPRLREAAAQGRRAPQVAPAPVPAPIPAPAPVAAPAPAPQAQAALEYRISLEWVIYKGPKETEFGECETTIRRAAPNARFTGASQRCEAAYVTYDLDINETGTVKGTLRVDTTFGSTPMFRLSGSTTKSVARTVRAEIEARFEPR